MKRLLTTKLIIIFWIRVSYAKLGKRFEQHQAQAYGYAWQGRLHATLEQLELAKQAGGSFYQLSVIESDLREMLDARRN